MNPSEAASLIESTDEAGNRWLKLSKAPRNLLDPSLMDALRDGLTGADEDDGVRAIILTGEEEWFCGGLDTEQFKHGADPVDFAGSGIALMKTFPTLGKPVIAAVNGNALALGYAIVCACDLAVGVESAEFGCFEATVGLWPMTSQVAALKRLPPKWALENIMTGDPFTGPRAAEVGIINAVVPAAELEERASDYAERATRAGDAVARGRRAFYRFLDLSYDEAHTEALGEFEAMFAARNANGD
jgi:enoyl-CoA hydratase/carnithine racemase